jgi:multiple sugar transport system permease protein
MLHYSLERKKQVSGMFMVLPGFLILCIFVIYPVINAAYLSLFDYNLLKGTSSFTGIENYKLAFGDDRFWGSLGNTFYFSILYVPLLTVTALALALALNKRTVKISNFFQSLFFLPAITSMAIVAIGWRYILDPNIGIIFSLLERIGGRSIALLQDPDRAMPTVVGISLWKTAGFNMVILIAGLKSIPDSYYEAASIDGAGKSHTFFGITLPLLLPSLSFVIITNIIGSFQVFDQIYVLTKGGPIFRTEVLVYYIYYQGFNLFKIGYASAISFLLFLIILVVALFQMKQFMKQEVEA